MSTAESATGGTIDTEITVANLDDVGGSTTARTVSATVPRPAVVRDNASSTSSKGVPLSVALGKCRGVVDIRLPCLGNAK